MSQGHTRCPEIWIRHEDKQRNKWTPNGRYWERAKPTSYIDNTRDVLKLNVVELKNIIPYTIALLYDEREREIPIPLEIAIAGNICCARNCGNLQKHLCKIWTTRTVLRALRLSSNPPNGECVFSLAFNDYNFDRDITDLYLKCSRFIPRLLPGIFPEVPVPPLSPLTISPFPLRLPPPPKPPS
ncbi:hypothetical protein CPB86DRAFT_196847 [Serendipita vermifera]|nr:hypothetical protein CPB86DRAFT_196847 [Serendipita vermifera]